jgi:hypothetical protein
MLGLDGIHEQTRHSGWDNDGHFCVTGVGGDANVIARRGILRGEPLPWTHGHDRSGDKDRSIGPASNPFRCGAINKGCLHR